MAESNIVAGLFGLTPQMFDFSVGDSSLRFDWILSIEDKQEKIFEIDVEKLVKEAGYGNGEFKVVFNFLKNYVGNENQKQKVWIHEVSPSRTEIRIQPLITNDEAQNRQINRRYTSFMDGAAELRENVINIKNQIDKVESITKLKYYQCS